MFTLTVTNLDFDSGLQIIQADVSLTIDKQKIINESLCVDIGLASLLRSVVEDVTPDRWSENWDAMPFFVCGCGDPDCKAFSFMVTHLTTEKLEFTEIEEKENSEPRVYQKWVLNRHEYRAEVLHFAKQFLAFVEPLDYQPFFPGNVERIKQLVNKIKG